MTDVNRIDVSADFQDITITLGEYGDDEARLAFSVVDSGGDGSLAYNNVSGVFTYTGPSASEVRAHFSAGSGISIASGVITNTRADTNTTYAVSAVDGTAGKKIIRLTGSDAVTDDVTLVQGSNVTLTRVGDEITIASTDTDTNTTYSISAETVTGGANLRLTDSGATTDDVKFASGTGITVSRTDANTVNIATTITQYTDALARAAISGGTGISYSNLTGVIASTITQYTDALARQSISVAVNTGDGDLTYNNTNGQFSYTGPGNTEYRAAIGVSNASGDGTLTYSTSTGVITYAGPTNANYRGAVSAANTGTGYGALSYDTPTGVFTYDKVTGANIRTEVVDGRNLTYTGSTLNLDKALVDVNSVTAESATNLTLQGKQLVLNTVDVTTAGQFLNLNSLGYTYDIPLNTNSVAAKAFATNVGTTSATFNRYTVVGDVTLGSNLITNAVLLNNSPMFGGAVVDWTTVTDFATLPILDYDGGFFQLGVAASGVGSITGTYNSNYATNTQTATITLTVRDSAIATTANCQAATASGLEFIFSHYIRNATATNVEPIGKFPSTGFWITGSPAYRDASANGYQDSSALAVTYVSYDYTGTQDWQISPRRVLNLQPKQNANEHVRIPFALGVGPGSVMTNRGILRDTFDAMGININNNGKLTGFTGRTGLNLTQFKNNSNFQSGTTAERCGPNFTFNSFAGNEDTANNALFLTDQDGIGQITWFAQPASSSLVSSGFPPASITVKATETHDTSTKQGSGMYLQYTPNSIGNAAPKTFLRAENVTTELLARTTLKLGKISTASNSTARALSTAAATTWVTVDDTSAAFTVPVKFPAYTRSAAGAITGSVGMQICISDSSGSGGSKPNGMMAFWDTTNNRWSYIHDHQAL